MSTDIDRDLSDKQQLLLSRYFDGECGVISRILAKRLISSNPSALQFLNSLQQHSNTFRSYTENSQSSVDLWSRIDARIEQEERASFYLGNRRVEESRTSLLTRVTSSHTALGGLSGAALAAVVLFVVYQPKNILTFSAPQNVAFNASPQFQPVALGNSAPAGSANPFTQVSARPMEVDWMRSNGSLALIPDSQGTSTIIWVRRKMPRTGASLAASQLQPTPLGRAEPTATIGTAGEWLDGSPQAGAK